MRHRPLCFKNSFVFCEFYGFDDKKATQGVEIYREYYRDKGLYENLVYDGVEDMLKNLKEKGKTLLVATSKPEKFALTILKHFKLFDYFDFVYM